MQSGRKQWQVAGKVTSQAIYFIFCMGQGYVARDRKSRCSKYVKVAGKGRCSDKNVRKSQENEIHGS